MFNTKLKYYYVYYDTKKYFVWIVFGNYVFITLPTNLKII